MRIKPRQQLLEIWEAVADQLQHHGLEHAVEGTEPNSVSETERLLCLLYPATEVPALRLDVPDETADDVLAALRKLGDSVEIPRALLNGITEYFDRNTVGGAPVFAGGDYYDSYEPGVEVTEEQRMLGVVDSYSLSITLCLATLGFLKVFSRGLSRPDLRRRADELAAATNVRLSAAMVALLRSFSVSAFEVDSPEGRSLCSLLNRSGESNRVVVEQLQRRLRPLRATIRDYFTIGLTSTDALENENLLFECGWSWGIVDGAPPIQTSEEVGPQEPGLAQDAPYLYFTVVALDGIADLFSDRTLTLGLLNEEQQRLAQALRLRWELTQRYWSALARFDDQAWPLENIPWRTTDRQESLYFSLLVSSILVQDLVRRRAPDTDLARTVAVLEELAVRSKTTRRMVPGDAALALHSPGVGLTLQGSERLGPLLRWSVTDFSAQLLKRTIQLGGLSQNITSHDRLLRLAESVMDHLWERRIGSGENAKLWDDLSPVSPDVEEHGQVLSWSMTERMVEALIAAANLIEQTPIRSSRLTELATDLLSEADHLLDKEVMEASGGGFVSVLNTLRQSEARLQRARRLLRDRPGTACTLALQVLASLDELAAARRTASRGY
ncbi:SCO2524 family protein [Kitasatospora azatica]|uniref:SCO2524 family protein n=1 Tax=Kitasatospora azatica TaxID=58347 RepID=UPI000569BFC3|nr:SCO2524 family protein [Kitasatospora azatica]